MASNFRLSNLTLLRQGQPQLLPAILFACFLGIPCVIQGQIHVIESKRTLVGTTEGSYLSETPEPIDVRQECWFRYQGFRFRCGYLEQESSVGGDSVRVRLSAEAEARAYESWQFTTTYLATFSVSPGVETIYMAASVAGFPNSWDVAQVEARIMLSDTHSVLYEGFWTALALYGPSEFSQAESITAAIGSRKEETYTLSVSLMTWARAGLATGSVNLVFGFGEPIVSVSPTGWSAVKGLYR